jgi:tyrosine-protein phosphatase SIW14
MQYLFRSRAAALLIAGVITTAFAATDAPGVPNFHQVNEHVYRGGQPSALGFESLAKLGVKTIIDLRAPGEGADAEQKLVQSAGMQFINLPMRGMETPSNEKVWKALGILGDSSKWPVFVHCRRGKDRTGVILACYRIVHDRWENQKALDEARQIGMSWIERAMQNYVLHFQPASRPAPLGSQPEPQLSAQ